MCGPCQRWLLVALRSIVDMTAELPDLIVPVDLAVDDRWYWYEFPRRKDKDTGEPLPPEGEWRRADPLSAVGGAALVPGRRKQPRVSGGRDSAPVPVRLDVLDLLGDVARDGGIPVDGVHDTKVRKVITQPVDVKVWEGYGLRPIRDADDNVIGEELYERLRDTRMLDRRPALSGDGSVLYAAAGDQIGYVPVAAVLDQEMRAWIDAGAPGGRWRPAPTVPNLAEWLTNRLAWACDRYEAIDVTRGTISYLRGVLMSVLDMRDPEPEPCPGVECNRCDQRLLQRRNDGTGDVECMSPSCGKVFSAAQYADWVRHLGAYEASQRTPTEVADMLRPTYRGPDGAPS